MPVAYAKETLSKKFLEIIKDNIYYDIEDHDGRKILKGYLRIVQKDV